MTTLSAPTRLPRGLLLLGTLVVAWWLPTLAAAQDARPPIVSAARATEAPVVDGVVGEQEWSPATPSDGFIQQQPRENEPSSERTEVRVMFDDRNLYIGLICFDSDPNEIVVTQSRRDGDLDDTDSVQIVLDTFDDDQNAFLFGTNPLGIEYDGQIAAEGRTGGGFGRPGTGFGGGGSQRGVLAGFNRNWDGDWRVTAQITARGWEAELAIPFKTLRYVDGIDRTWGINVLRNIRRRNEQSFLAPIPRSYDINRISLAGSLTGLELPQRRDLLATPYVLSGLDTDYRLEGDQTDALGDIGLDLKWGVTPNLAADFTVNTDFAQVEADEEQVNLTRFSLFFPEKRPFFLENATTFQFGQPREIDLFFSRRIGLSDTGQPIDIIAGGRLTGKIGAYKVGILTMQTDSAIDPSGETIAPSNNFSAARVQREFGRSNIGAIFVNRQGTGEFAASSDYNRVYGLDTNLTVGENGKIFSFLARSDSPGDLRSDYSGRALYNFTNSLWNVQFGYTQVGERFNAEVGFVPRVGYRKPEFRVSFTPQPEGISWIRRLNPHMTFDRFYGFDGLLESEWQHYDFGVQFQDGGRAGFRLDHRQDRPRQPFRIFSGRDGREVLIPAGLYGWDEWTGTYATDPSATVFLSGSFGAGSFYDGHFNRTNVDTGFRSGAAFLTTVGYIRNNIDLPADDFSTDLVRVKSNYFFTTNALVQALIQFNSQTEQLSSNIRFALLDRSGTGLFLVYNEDRDTYPRRSQPLGRAFIVKYSRLVDF